MKDLIISALKEAGEKLERTTPLTKKEKRSISIADVKPVKIIEFMQENNIPEDADFDGRDNGYDAWDDICLSWYIDVPTTERDKEESKRKRFEYVAWKHVFESLTSNGYTVAGYNPDDFKQFKDTSLYDMFVEGDFERLVKYYSLRFKRCGL